MSLRSGVSVIRGRDPRRQSEATRSAAVETLFRSPAFGSGAAHAFRQAFSLEALPLAALAFLIGRATVLQTMSPFGLALFAAVLSLAPRRSAAAGVAVALGILSAGARPGCVEFLGGAAGLLLLRTAFARQRPIKPMTLAALSFTVTIIAGSAKAFITDPTPYSFLMAAFGGLVTFVLTLVYLAALPPLVFTKRPLSLGPEQMVAGAITAATALAGVSGLGYGAARLSGVAGGLVVLVAAIACGPGTGAAVGTVAGAVTALCGAGGLGAVGITALAGLLAGSFRDFGKVGSAAGYFFGTLLLSPLVEQPAYLQGLVLEAALAAIAILAVPTGWLASLRSALGQPPGGAEGGDEEGTGRERAGRRLMDYSAVFGQLASTLREVSAGAATAQSQPSASDLGASAGSQPAEERDLTLDSLAEAACRVCQSCRLYRSCWKGEPERTRGVMAGMLEVTASRGELETRDVPMHIRRRCIHLGELVTTMNFLHEIATLDRHWRKKMDESRNLIYQQLDGLALILRSLGEGLQEEAASEADLGRALAKELDRSGVVARRVAVTRLPEGKSEFEITADVCDTGEACREIVLPLASSVAGVDLTVAETHCGLATGCPECTFRLSAPRLLDFKMGVAQARKSPSGVSGDSYLIRDLPGDRLAAVLSDGTGAGPRAADESRTIVKMLEELFRVGFDTELAVETVNSVLLLRSSQERFATLDLLTVDLHSGQAKFTKIGAPPSYVRRGRDVTVVEAANVPLGVLPVVGLPNPVRTLRSGDLIVMATDGLVASNLDRASSAWRDNWIVDFLADAGEAGPQEIADALVEAAVSLGETRLAAVSGGSSVQPVFRGLRDDVTVVALRFGPPEGA